MSHSIELQQEAQLDILYNNAGIVLGKKGTTRRMPNLIWGWTAVTGEVEEWNSKVEDFFPLDIKVMGESNKLEETNKGRKKLIQEVQVNEKISDIVAVKLDQVVITETGIGRGSGKEVKWGKCK